MWEPVLWTWLKSTICQVTPPRVQAQSGRHRDSGVWCWCQVHGLMQFPLIFAGGNRFAAVCCEADRVAQTACRVSVGDRHPKADMESLPGDGAPAASVNDMCVSHRAGCRGKGSQGE